MPDLPTACVIGAGLSGLAAGKSLADHGVPYECFETSDRIGGNWAFGNPYGHSSAYRSLHPDTSKRHLSLRDFPIPDSYPDYPHHSQIKDYLERYAQEFGLGERIQFENGVERATRLPHGGWEVLTDDGTTRPFDVLVVANGHHWDPRYPSFPGRFDGEAIHSHHYVDPGEPLDLHGKRILVVGIGNSAADIVSELSHASLRNSVSISTRSGAHVLPKYVLGKPPDHFARTIPQLPLGLQRRFAALFARVVVGRMEDYGLPRPDHRFLEAHPTVSSELLLRLGSGDAQVKPDVARLDGDRVRFVDGSVEPFDAIVYATGYNISFPFFAPELLSAPGNRLPLFKRMVEPGLDDLVFVGLAQALPTLFPFVECQSRLLGRYLAGTYRPPSRAQMEKAIGRDEARFVGHYRDRPRHTQQVDFYVYEHDMRTKELPAGARRVAELGRVELAGRATGAASGAPAAAR